MRLLQLKKQFFLHALSRERTVRLFLVKSIDIGPRKAGVRFYGHFLCYDMLGYKLIVFLIERGVVFGFVR